MTLKQALRPSPNEAIGRSLMAFHNQPMVAPPQRVGIAADTGSIDHVQMVHNLCRTYG